MSDESRPSDGLWPGLLIKARRDSWLASHVVLYGRNDRQFEWPPSSQGSGKKMSKGDPLIVISLVRDLRYDKHGVGAKEDIIYVLTPSIAGWNIAWESMFENAYV